MLLIQLIIKIMPPQNENYAAKTGKESANVMKADKETVTVTATATRKTKEEETALNDVGKQLIKNYQIHQIRSI